MSGLVTRTLRPSSSSTHASSATAKRYRPPGVTLARWQHPHPNVSLNLRRREPAPHEAFADGEYRWGTFDGPIANVNLLDRWSGPARRFHGLRSKEWQAFQLVNDRYFVLGAVYDAKLLGLVQIVVVDLTTGEARPGSTGCRRRAVGRPRPRRDGLDRRLRLAGATVRNDVADGRLAIVAEDRGGKGGVADGAGRHGSLRPR
ncbi:MAG: DUF2804 family protein [Actinobacteria bacterium]|nr:DUF2804 family protein [Actinomycetota bacterium]